MGRGFVQRCHLDFFVYLNWKTEKITVLSEIQKWKDSHTFLFWHYYHGKWMILSIEVVVRHYLNCSTKHQETVSEAK